MTERNDLTDPEVEAETFPVEPRYHPIHKIPRKIYDFLASARLAMALLVTILACCVIGVTIWRGAEAGRVIFGTYWFNGLLVLLVVNVACCFFGRIWGRRLTLISFGMILFHLSFLAILVGVVYNSLFYFRGNIRLTEGETLLSSDPQSYDTVEMGRFFKFSRIKGETSLIRMHAGYKIGSDDKRAAYEVAVGERNDRKNGIIYITNKLSHRGFDYFNDKEGYSLLVMLSDRGGKELYGAHVPLQSIKQQDGSFRYVTGFKEGDTTIASEAPFPPTPETPLMALRVGYSPSKLQERSGEAEFEVYSLDQTTAKKTPEPLAKGKAVIGAPFAYGNYLLTPKEVRYWAAMTVRYEPGKPLVLLSLWTGLAGMVITTAGRMIKSHQREKRQQGGLPV